MLADVEQILREMMGDEMSLSEGYIQYDAFAFTVYSDKHRVFVLLLTQH